jgi:hypothetical protein
MLLFCIHRELPKRDVTGIRSLFSDKKAARLDGHQPKKAGVNRGRDDPGMATAALSSGR